MAALDWQKSLRDGENTDIPRGVYDLAEPLVIAKGADPIIHGNRSVLVTHDEGMDALTASGAVRIDNLRIMTTAERGGAAFYCRPQHQISGLELTNVEVIHDGDSEKGAFRYGLLLNNCWNATLKVNVQGYAWDYTEEALRDPRMEIALDLGNSQEARCDVMIGGAGIGIRSVSEQQGECEGLSITGRWIIHCRRAIHLEGAVYGGTATPWARITGLHAFYTEEGIFALHRHGLVISESNWCGSHLNPTGTVAMWLVDCPNLHVSENTVWRTFPGPDFTPAGLGIVVDQTNGALISHNQITKDVALPLYTSGSCRNVTMQFNR